MGERQTQPTPDEQVESQLSEVSVSEGCNGRRRAKQEERQNSNDMETEMAHFLRYRRQVGPCGSVVGGNQS